MLHRGSNRDAGGPSVEDHPARVKGDPFDQLSQRRRVLAKGDMDGTGEVPFEQVVGNFRQIGFLVVLDQHRERTEGFVE